VAIPTIQLRYQAKQVIRNGIDRQLISDGLAYPLQDLALNAFLRIFSFHWAIPLKR
jgi:hypothetical protein